MGTFRFKNDLRDHCAIVQPRLYDCAMVTQIIFRALHCLVDLQSVCDGVGDLRLLTVRGGVLRAVTGLATVSCGCALVSRLAIRALYRLFVLLAFPSKFCSSLSVHRFHHCYWSWRFVLFHLLRKVAQPFDVRNGEVRQLLS